MCFASWGSQSVGVTDLILLLKTGGVNTVSFLLFYI